MNQLKNNKIMRYFGILLLFAIFLLFGFKLEGLLIEKAAIDYSLVPYFIFSVLFPVLIGLLLALPSNLQKLSTQNLTVNWSKLFILGIPALLVLFLPLFFFNLANVIPFISILFGNEKLHFVAGILFGYILLSSFENKRNK